MKNKLKAFFNDESGDFGIKQIAITVAVIIIIGAAMVIVRDNLSTWIGDIWDRFMDMIDKIV